MKPVQDVAGGVNERQPLGAPLVAADGADDLGGLVRHGDAPVLIALCYPVSYRVTQAINPDEKQVDVAKKLQTRRRSVPKVEPLEIKGNIDESQPFMIGYARVSMADQNPLMQIDALKAAGAHRIYSETASGATVENRPVFQAMMQDLRRGDILLVWKLDRLGRSTQQVLETFAYLDQHGILVRVLTQPGMDTTTPTGRMMVTVMAACAQLEREFIVERTARGLAAAKERGRVGGAKSKHSDADIAKAHELHGTAGGARHLGLSKVQFLRRLNKIRGL